ncbi:MAG: TetR/AcrR family transcriptional regulator [Betaproteobacteria bacterium]
MPRTKEYDEEALLKRAMETFWSLGYDGTAVEDLVARTGVHRASLYTAYPDKRALFIAGINLYLDAIVGDNLQRLNQGDSPGEAVKSFFINLVEAPIERLRRGCLLTNTAAEMGVEDREVSALIRKAFVRMEDALYERLLQARAAGELKAGVEPRSLARLLIVVLQGVRIMSRVSVDRETMREAVSAALSGIATTQGKRTKTRHRSRKTRAGAGHPSHFSR